MLKRQAIWNGTEAESFDLLASVQHHCACEFDKSGARIKTCSPHDALVHSQRFLDGLLFARRIARQLVAEEGVSQLLASQTRHLADAAA